MDDLQTGVTADAEDPEGPDDQIILARATINLPGGVKPGYEYWVDAASPYIASALQAGYLVRVGS